jgi:hypothetical protein
MEPSSAGSRAWGCPSLLALPSGRWLIPMGRLPDAISTPLSPSGCSLAGRSRPGMCLAILGETFWGHSRGCGAAPDPEGTSGRLCGLRSSKIQFGRFPLLRRRFGNRSKGFAEPGPAISEGMARPRKCGRYFGDQDGLTFWEGGRSLGSVFRGGCETSGGSLKNAFLRFAMNGDSARAALRGI